MVPARRLEGAKLRVIALISSLETALPLDHPDMEMLVALKSVLEKLSPSPQLLYISGRRGEAIGACERAKAWVCEYDDSDLGNSDSSGTSDSDMKESRKLDVYMSESGVDLWKYGPGLNLICEGDVEVTGAQVKKSDSRITTDAEWLWGYGGHVWLFESCIVVVSEDEEMLQLSRRQNGQAGSIGRDIVGAKGWCVAGRAKDVRYSSSVENGIEIDVWIPIGKNGFRKPRLPEKTFSEEVEGGWMVALLGLGGSEEREVWVRAVMGVLQTQREREEREHAEMEMMAMHEMTAVHDAEVSGMVAASGMDNVSVRGDDHATAGLGGGVDVIVGDKYAGIDGSHHLHTATPDPEEEKRADLDLGLDSTHARAVGEVVDANAHMRGPSTDNLVDGAMPGHYEVYEVHHAVEHSLASSLDAAESAYATDQCAETLYSDQTLQSDVVDMRTDTARSEHNVNADTDTALMYGVPDVLHDDILGNNDGALHAESLTMAPEYHIDGNFMNEEFLIPDSDFGMNPDLFAGIPEADLANLHSNFTRVQPPQADAHVDAGWSAEVITATTTDAHSAVAAHASGAYNAASDANDAYALAVSEQVVPATAAADHTLIADHLVSAADAFAVDTVATDAVVANAVDGDWCVVEREAVHRDVDEHGYPRGDRNVTASNAAVVPSISDAMAVISADVRRNQVGAVVDAVDAVDAVHLSRPMPTAMEGESQVHHANSDIGENGHMLQHPIHQNIVEDNSDKHVDSFDNGLPAHNPSISALSHAASVPVYAPVAGASRSTMSHPDAVYHPDAGYHPDVVNHPDAGYHADVVVPVAASLHSDLTLRSEGTLLSDAAVASHPLVRAAATRHEAALALTRTCLDLIEQERSRVHQEEARTVEQIQRLREVLRDLRETVSSDSSVS